MKLVSVKDLDVYQLAFELAMEIFHASKRFPAEEKYSLTDQVRRSSRSVCANLREVWAKRRYENHFISKLTDCDGESGETGTWLDFAFECGYLSEPQYDSLAGKNARVGQMLGGMIKKPAGFLIKKQK
jgi:four helix bundle protein